MRRTIRPGTFSRETKVDIKEQHLGCFWKCDGHNGAEVTTAAHILDLEMCSTVKFLILAEIHFFS